MKSRWMVTANYINGKPLYQVYRNIDVDAVDHSGNREFATKLIPNYLEAQRIADGLNEAEGAVNQDGLYSGGITGDGGGRCRD